MPMTQLQPHSLPPTTTTARTILNIGLVLWILAAVGIGIAGIVLIWASLGGHANLFMKLP